MALIVPNEGDMQLLTELLSHGEDWLLRLYVRDLRIREDDTREKYEASEATFRGYQARILQRCIGENGWSLPVVRPPSSNWTSRKNVGASQHQQQTWTCDQGKEDIYGYFITGIRSGRLIAVEAFDEPRKMIAGAELSVTPVFENA